MIVLLPEDSILRLHACQIPFTQSMRAGPTSLALDWARDHAYYSADWIDLL